MPATPKQQPRAIAPQKSAGRVAESWTDGCQVEPIRHGSGMGHWDAGYNVEMTCRGDIKASHVAPSPGSRTDDEEIECELARIAAALTAAGILCETRDGAVWVPVDQGQEPTP